MSAPQLPKSPGPTNSAPLQSGSPGPGPTRPTRPTRPERLARTALWAPLAMILWLPLSAVALMFLVNALGMEADKPATEYDAADWAFTVLMNGLFVALPLIVGCALSVWASAKGAGRRARRARRAMILNGTLLLGWWLVIGWSLVQDFIERA